MKRTIAMLLAVVAAVVFLLPTVVAQKIDQADVQLKAAIKKEVVDGDLKAAIELYRKIAQGSDRAVAARALIRMGQCYAKLGDDESTKAYQRVVTEFADQKEAAEEARVLLAAGNRDRRSASGVSEQQVWVMSEIPRPYPRHLSPDGRYIPYTDIGSNRLKLYDVTTGETRTVVDRERGFAVGFPALSPDGRRIAYTRYVRPPMTGTDFELRVADLDGSQMKVVASSKQQGLWAAGWSPDGGQILARRRNTAAGFSIVLVAVADGSARELTTGGEDTNGCFSPDGKYVVTYPATPQGSGATQAPGSLKLRPVDGGAAIPLFDSPAANWAPFWAPDGRHIVFLSDRSGATALWGIAMSNGRPASEPKLLKRGVGSMRPLGFTRDGSFYYASTRVSDWNVYMADLDPGTGLALSKAERVNQRYVGNAGLAAEWSPDGQFVAYTGSSQEAGANSYTTVRLIVWSERTKEEREVPLVPPFERGLSVAELQWFPDGRSVLAQVVGDGNRRSFFCRIDAQTGKVTPLLDLNAGNSSVYYPALSRDGTTLYYVQISGDSRTDSLMRRDLARGEAKVLHQADWIENIVVSADGRELLFEGSVQGLSTMSLLVMPAEGGPIREFYRSKDYMLDHAWSRDGQRVWMVPSPPAPDRTELVSMPVAGGQPQPSGLTDVGFSLSLRPDGRRITYTTGEGARDEVWVIRNLLPSAKARRK